MKTIVKYMLGLFLALTLIAQNRVLVLDGNGDYVALPQPIMDGNSFSIEA
ncbi:MAG: LamG domain-containing protein [Candidatus Marinimicrobia bacterium]|nr:LamG domain-containing protein [Candidatus Neomarinimicrobiota bacterium]